MRTVFVIGAGANAEIDMPVGDDLKTRIANILKFTETDSGTLSGDDTISYALQLCSQTHGLPNVYKLNELINVAMDISQAMPLSISIDNFIDARRGDQRIATCGKLAIVQTIRVAEHYCKLFESKAEHLNDTWYPLFFQKITEGCHVDELAARFDDISFIIFNYDRCFEYFMYLSLMVYYNINHYRAREIVQQLHINHPYGTVGELWDDMGNLNFGEKPNPIQLISLAKNIKTFTESREQEKDVKNTVQYYTERADRIIFLGFAYHDQNLDLLFKHYGALNVDDDIPVKNHIACYGTGHGISENDLKKIRSIFRDKNNNIRECDISQATCSQFFHDYWYRLTFKSS
jgi:hypothetical protein